MSADTASSAAGERVFELAKEHELRFEVDAEETVVVMLVKGTAELFGTELAIDRQYTFTNNKFAIFTWRGCTLTVTGACKMVYEADETPMVSFINAHAALDNLRKKAKSSLEAAQATTAAASSSSSSAGPVAAPPLVRVPRAMLVGPTDAGKSTLTRILLGYACRAGWQPTLVDLDVGQSCVTVPGCVAATPVDLPVAVEDSTVVSLKAPIVYFYGHTTPSKAPELYRRLCGNLAAAVDKRWERHPEAACAGAIINTCGWVEGKGFDLIVETARTFAVDVILVLGHERLYSQLRNHADVTCSVAKLAKSGGVVARDMAYRAKTRARAIREYFYGPGADLCPYERVIGFEQIFIYSIGGGDEAACPSSALPIGMKPLVDPNQLHHVLPSQDLVHSVLGVSFASAYGDPLIDTNIAGVVFVKAVDMHRKTITMLTPCSGPLPEKFLLQGSLTFVD